MAKVFLDTGDNYRIVNDDTQVFGAIGDDTDSIIIEAGAEGITVNANVDRVDFAGSIADFTFVQGFTANMEVWSADGTTLIASIPVQEDADGTQLVFADGAVDAIFDTGTGALAVGGEDLATVDPAAITPDAAAIDDTVTTEAQLDDDTPVDEFSLTEALGDLQAAQQDVSDFLSTAADNEAVAADLEARSVDPVTDAEVRTSITNADTDADGALSDHIADPEGDSAEVGEIDIYDGDSLNILNAKLTDAQDDLATAEAAVAAVDGLTVAKNALLSAQEAYAAAIETAASTDTNFKAEIASVNVADATASGDNIVVGSIDYAPADDVVVEDTIDKDPIIVVGADGSTLEAADATVAGYTGFADLLAAAQAAFDAAAAEVEAEETFQGAIEDVAELEDGTWNDFTIALDSNAVPKDADGLYALADGTGYVVKAVDGTYWPADVTTDLDAVGWDTTNAGDKVASADVNTTAEVTELPLSVVEDAISGVDFIDTGATLNLTDGAGEFGAIADLTTAVITATETVETIQGHIDTREELIADAAATQALVDGLDQVDVAVTDAETVLTDEGFEVESIDAAAEFGTAEQDIFLLGDTDSTITGFELTETDAEGNVTAGDRIFVGEQLGLVVAGEGEDITDDLGDSAAIEAIVVDDGADTTIYFEDKAFAGNGSTDADTVEIILSGVTGGDVAIDADSFLTVA